MLVDREKEEQEKIVGDDEIQVVPVDNTTHVEKVTLTHLKRLDLVSGNIFESTGSVRRKVTVRSTIVKF